MVSGGSRGHRRSIRLRGYDYTRPGAYFVTICVQDRLRLFGTVVAGAMQASAAGRMVERWWLELHNTFPTVRTDEYIVMPDHFHGIVIIVPPDDAVTENVNDAGHVGADPCVCPYVAPDGCAPDIGDVGIPSDDGGVGAHDGMSGNVGNEPGIGAHDGMSGDVGNEPGIGAHDGMSGNVGNEPGIGAHDGMSGNVGNEPGIGARVGASRDVGNESGRGAHDGMSGNVGNEPVIGAHMGAPRPGPTPQSKRAVVSLPTIVQWFKTMTTNEYIRGVKNLGWEPFPGKLWQRNYYEHIIRGGDALDRIRRYIRNNPRQWGLDHMRDNPLGK